MKCVHCGNEAPDGAFCTRCGASQNFPSGPAASRFRLHSYAPHPGEHVLHPGVLTTIMPHLGHHKVGEFRWALGAGIVALFILYLAGLITAAILASAFLIPLLYLLYLYEAQVYRDEPVTVLGLTIGGGVVVGVAFTLILNAVVSPVTYFNLMRHMDILTLLGLTVLVPVIQEIVKPIPVLPLLSRPRFPETADGLVFGVAAGLGFSIAATLINYSAVLHDFPVRTQPGQWIFPLVTLAVILPLLQGSATGAIAMAIWRMRRGQVGVVGTGAMLVALAAHIAFALGSQLFTNAGFGGFIILAWQSMVVVALLLLIRYLLHQALLEEGIHLGYSPATCPNCHRHVMASAFCPHCGKALATAPRQVQMARAGSAADAVAPREGG